MSISCVKMMTQNSHKHEGNSQLSNCIIIGNLLMKYTVKRCFSKELNVYRMDLDACCTLTFFEILTYTLKG